MTLLKQKTTYPGVITAYQVLVDGKSVGHVWSTRVLSYRGSQGWNRGIRLKDFHPLEWRHGEYVGNRESRVGYPSRARAVTALLKIREQ